MNQSARPQLWTRIMSNELQVIPGAQYSFNNDIYEVVTSSDLITLRSINTKLHRHIGINDFAAMLANKTITKYQNAPIDLTSAPLLLALDERHQARYIRRHTYIQKLEHLFAGSLPRGKTNLAIQSIAAEIKDPKPPNYSTVYNWKKIFDENNRNPLALIRSEPNRPRGNLLSEETHELIQHFIHTEFFKAERASAKTIHKLICGEIQNINLERSKYTADFLKVPSYSTLRRAIMKLDGYLVDSHRHSRNFVTKKYHFGVKTEVAESLYGQAQGDTALMNLFVVDEHGIVMGRPILSAILDLGCRACTGWDISLGAPNAESFIKAIKMAVEAKPEGAIGGKMEELVVDNGPEVRNDRVKLIARLLGIELRYVPPGQPNAKAFIERFFRTVDTGLTHFIPGTTKSNPLEREDYDSTKQATLTLDELRAIFKRWLDEVYHETIHSSLHMSPKQALKKMSENHIPPERFSRDDLDFACLCSKRRTITGGRTQIFNLTWTGASLPDLARRLGKKLAIVYYDPTNLGTVWTAHPEEPRHLFPAFATNPQYQEGLSLQSHNAVKERLAEEGKEFTNTAAHQALREIYSEISEISKSSQKPKDSQKPKSAPKSKKAKKTKKATKTIPKSDDNGNDNGSPITQQLADQQFSDENTLFKSYRIRPT
ncbi:Integrase core domain protein [compost metagenome]